jgi:EAL domain-containing protein (putative c-di-GMP-specific phosphodiesterase class I)
MGGPKRAVPGELLRNADLAMYRAKRGGKGRYAVFEPSLHRAATAEESLADELRRAVAQHEFVVAYQPVMRLTTERVVGFEALVRWVHPERGLLMPGTFVAAAESAGLISAIGQHVLDTACGALAHWQSLGAALRLTMSVNLSERQLYDPELPGMVAKMLSHHRLRPDALVLEITEATLMGNLAMSHQRLRELKGLGVRLALDDFGTGHSSSGYLRDFSFDILKLDPSVIEGLGSDPDATGAARDAIEIGDNLRVRTLAEGVESRNQLTTLRRLGCELGQGFLFSRPLEAQEVEATMAAAGSPRMVQPGADLITPDIARRLVQVPS